jgi:photosystem II stability/assembly factor-like uncharacterized protein
MKKHLFFVFLLTLISFSAVNAQWGKTTCPDDYSIFCLAAKGDSLIAGTVEKVYLSSDNGNTWSELWNGLPWPGYFNSILTKGRNIYIGTDEGVYLSTEDGANFTLANNGYTGAYVQEIVKNGPDIYIASSSSEYNGGGIFLSSDNCQNWTKITGTIPVTLLNVYSIVVKDNMIFAGTDRGIYVSSDNGATWSEKNNGLALSSYNIKTICIVGQKIFAGTTDGLYVSNDNGTNWTIVLNGMPADEWVTEIELVGSDVFVGGDYGGGSFVSIDEGESWIDNSAGLSSMQILSLAHNNAYIFAGTGAVLSWYTGGVFKQDLSWLAVVEMPENSSYKLYPIPVIDKLIIECRKPVNASISIFDLKGQLIIEGQLSENKTVIDVGNMVSGIYIVKIVGDNSIEIRKIIIE